MLVFFALSLSNSLLLLLLLLRSFVLSLARLLLLLALLLPLPLLFSPDSLDFLLLPWPLGRKRTRKRQILPSLSSSNFFSSFSEEGKIKFRPDRLGEGGGKWERESGGNWETRYYQQEEAVQKRGRWSGGCSQEQDLKSALSLHVVCRLCGCVCHTSNQIFGSFAAYLLSQTFLPGGGYYVNSKSSVAHVWWVKGKRRRHRRIIIAHETACQTTRAAAKKEERKKTPSSSPECM